MSTVREQLRNHYRAVDESQETITWSEIVERLESETVHEVTSPSPRRTGLLVAVVSAVIVLVLGLVSILTFGQETPPADTVVPTTVVVPTPTTPPVDAETGADGLIRVSDDFERVDFADVEPLSSTQN